MKKPVLVVGLIGLSLVMSGCGASVSDPVPSHAAATADPNVAGAISTPIDKCRTTINVIGVGDPGTRTSTEGLVTDAYKALKEKLVGKESIGKISGVDEDKITLVFPKYEGNGDAIESPVDNPDAPFNGYFQRYTVAGEAVVRAVEDADKSCPGSSSVLIGYGFGAAAMHSAAPSLQSTSSAQAGKKLADQVLGVILMSDPIRNHQFEVARVDDELLSESHAPAQGRDNAHMMNNGSRGGAATDWGNAFKGVISVCNLHDLQCDFPPTEMTDPKKRDAMIASHGGMDAIKKSMMNYGYSARAMMTATSWVTKNIESAFAADRKYPAGTQQSEALGKYLKYVNTGHGGATVVQDVFDFPAIVNTCDADYTIIAARGSGEPIEGNAYDKDGKKIDSNTILDGTIINGGQPAQAGAPRIQGLTEFPATFAWEIKSLLPKERTVRFVPVDYEAVPIVGSLLVATNIPKARIEDWYIGSYPQGYFDSADKGAKILTNVVLDIEKRCPVTKIIVMGYSQGAQVVHQALSRFSFEQADHVSSVVLIADPLRSNDDLNSVVYDPKNNPDGLAQNGSSLRSGPINGSARGLLSGFAIPSSLKDRVIEVCDTDDIVCFAGLGAWMPAHLSSYRLISHYKFPSEWAVYATQEHENYRR